MKKYLLISFISIFSLSAAFSQNIVFSENFESLSIPAGWTQEKVIGASLVPWAIQSGGHQGNPPSAYQGTYNAFFQYQSYNGETTKLITPPIDLSDVLKPELRFAHAQDVWYASGNDWWDKLKVYYKRGADSAWVLLDEYTDPVPNWTMRSILLPDSSLSSTYYLAFEGITGYGHGVCIDTVRVIETGVIPKYLESIDVVQATTSFIATGTQHNPILRIDLNVMGNDGNLFLDSIAIKSLNTSDSDIPTNGVKLFATNSITFSDEDLKASGNFSSGTIVFDNLAYDIPRGYSYLWLAYDVKTDNNHELHGHIADAKIDAESININNNLYPYVNKSPSGSRVIYEALLYDNFETDKGWRFTGEFERGTPMGLAGERGKPDPSQALSGVNVIGTDLSDDGMYPNSLTDTAYVAAAPVLNCKYYKDIYLTFYRWLNVDLFDSARVLTSSDNINWNVLWKNQPSFYTDDAWNLQQFNLSPYFTRKEQARLKFTLGATNNINRYTGWNIDDVVIIGNYISKDVGITNWIAPLDGCGHTSAEKVTITIKNFAGDPLTDPIPVSFSFDGGTTIYYDTIQSPNLLVEGSITYQITKPIDLTTPGWYNNVYATTNLPGDEDATNNRINKQIFIVPTYTLPYSQNFETNYGYYRAGGTNSSWAYGVPSGTLINSAASGTKAWVTNLSGDYINNDSSYLESPCFNFSGKDSIIFEFKCEGISENQTDGLSILYSLNDGVNWYLLPNDHDYYWNWYNESNISELGLPGIDTTNGQWLTFRQLLPSTFSDQSSVKFRFVFESDAINTNEGFGIDDIRIYEAPYDVGVVSLISPFNKCEWSNTTQVKVEIKNFGPTTIKSGTKIPLVLKVNATTIKDTLNVLSDIPYNTTELFTFGQTVDMSNSGDYDFTVYTKLESDTYFYNETVSNDTLYATVTVQGMPNYNPFNDLIGANPVTTVTLDAGAGYDGYSWTLPPPDLTASSQTWGVQQEGWHYVTVTKNASPQNCTATDSVYLVQSEINLTMQQVYTELISLCERNLETEISVQVTNNSLKDLSPPTDTIFLGYQINELPIVEDTLILAGTLLMGDPIDFTFTQKADFRTPDDYTFKVFVNYLKDLDHDDDTITVNFKTKGYVDIEFASDTIYSSEADTLELSPSPIYSGYAWSTLETTNTITPSTNVSKWYIVTVTDAVVCGSDSDSIYVETYDFGINNIVSPVNACEYSTTENILVSVHNYSGNTYTTGTKIPFRYNYDSQGWVNDSATLASDFIPGTNKTISLSQTVDPSALGEHSLNIYINSLHDANHSNDTVDLNFETWGYPDVELAYDTIFTEQADTVVLIATPGLFSYSWNGGISTNDTLVVTNNFSANYVVEVNDEHGCDSDSDSTLIITYNLGVSSIISPKNGCQHSTSEVVRIAVKNYGEDVYAAGTSIPVGYIFNGTPVHETLVLGYDLGPSQVVYYTFTAKVNLASIASYNFKFFTDLELDVNHSNDTLVDIIKTFGYPSVEIGSDIYTTEPETLTLVAPSGFNYYKWNDGTLTRTLPVTYPATKTYSVTVTDINGCSANDHLTVYTYNVAADSINSPIEKCTPTSSETVIIGVTNNGADTLQVGRPLEVGYRLNGSTYVSESFTLQEILYPDSTSLFTMASHTANISANQLHQFKVFAKLSDIDVNTNDTTLLYVDNLKPDLDLGPDVNTSNTQYVLDAGSGYVSYEWFNNTTTTPTYTVDINNQTTNHSYSVTVTNSDGCVASDEIKVIFDITPDLSVISMSSPYSECWQSTKEYPVTMIIKNVGAINIPSTTSLKVGYRIGNGTPVTEDKILASALNANQTISHTFANDTSFSAANIYKLKPFVKYPDDIDVDNDTLFVDVDISQPDVTFDFDTIYFTTTVQVQPTQEFSTYSWSTGSQQRSITVSSTGKYTVTVTDANGCYGSGSVYCEQGTGIDNLIEGNGYNISYYPNPVSDKLMVQFDNQRSTDVIIEIINTNGQILYNNKLTDIQNTIERIDVNRYAKGVYYIRFKINNDIYTRKLIFQ